MVPTATIQSRILKGENVEAFKSEQESSNRYDPIEDTESLHGCSIVRRRHKFQPLRSNRGYWKSSESGELIRLLVKFQPLRSNRGYWKLKSKATAKSGRKFQPLRSNRGYWKHFRQLTHIIDSKVPTATIQSRILKDVVGWSLNQARNVPTATIQSRILKAVFFGFGKLAIKPFQPFDPTIEDTESIILIVLHLLLFFVPTATIQSRILKAFISVMAARG